jgi:hypothetical protein
LFFVCINLHSSIRRDPRFRLFQWVLFAPQSDFRT